jgi:guanylate kinase
MKKEKGKLFVISAPSGAGKTSLVKALLERAPHLRFSISYTTRKPRPAEKNGLDYFFVDHPTFETMVSAAEFLEHAKVFDNYYGTPKKQVQEILDGGEHVILEIDWQGAALVRKNLPEGQSIFILPPSREELELRLRGRGTDAQDAIERRLRDSVGDMTHWKEFDYVVVNDDFERALGDLASIVEGNGATLERDRPEVITLTKALLAKQ